MSHTTVAEYLGEPDEVGGKSTLYVTSEETEDSRVFAMNTFDGDTRVARVEMNKAAVRGLVEAAEAFLAYPDPFSCRITEGVTVKKG